MSSSGGGIKDPTKQIRTGMKTFEETLKSAEDVVRGIELEDVGNAAANVATWGMVGYDNGKLGKGAVTRGYDEFLGELTGRNLQRAEAGKAGIRLEQEEKSRQKDLADQRLFAERQDINASMQASASRGGSRSSRSNVLGRMEQDFLGM